MVEKLIKEKVYNEVCKNDFWKIIVDDSIT